jgi:hypothetical protein
MHLLIDRIPLREPFCAECLAAFWNYSIARLERAPEEPTQH